MLLAMTVFQISLFYMVNHPSKAIAGFTWTMTSSSVSIFAATFIWTEFCAVTASEESESLHGEHSVHLPAVRSPLSELLFLSASASHGHGPVDLGPLIGKFLVLYIAFNFVILAAIERSFRDHCFQEQLHGIDSGSLHCSFACVSVHSIGRKKSSGFVSRPTRKKPVQHGNTIVVLAVWAVTCHHHVGWCWHPVWCQP
jgi:hypothetical protein